MGEDTFGNILQHLCEGQTAGRLPLPAVTALFGGSAWRRPTSTSVDAARVGVCATSAAAEQEISELFDQGRDAQLAELLKRPIGDHEFCIAEFAAGIPKSMRKCASIARSSR